MKERPKVESPASSVRLASGFYPVVTDGTLSLADGILRFTPRNSKSSKDATITISHLREVHVGRWPHSVIAMALWFLIPWSVFHFGRLANLNVVSVEGSYYYRVEEPDKFAKRIRETIALNQSSLGAPSDLKQ